VKPDKERASTVTAIVDRKRCAGSGACAGARTEAFEPPDYAVKVRPGETPGKLLRETPND